MFEADFCPNVNYVDCKTLAARPCGVGELVSGAFNAGPIEAGLPVFKTAPLFWPRDLVRTLILDFVDPA